MLSLGLLTESRRRSIRHSLGNMATRPRFSPFGGQIGSIRLRSGRVCFFRLGRSTQNAPRELGLFCAITVNLTLKIASLCSFLVLFCGFFRVFPSFSAFLRVFYPVRYASDTEKSVEVISRGEPALRYDSRDTHYVAAPAGDLPPQFTTPLVSSALYHPACLPSSEI